MSVPSGLARKTLKWLRPPTWSQRENMMSPFGRTTGLRSWLWLNEICVIVAAVGVHRVQVEHALALVLVERLVAAAERLVDARLGLAVGREDVAATGRQVGRLDVVVCGRAGEAAEACRRSGRRPSCRIPRCSSGRCRPAALPIIEVLSAGQRIAKTIFLPSYETSGSETSPRPCVNCAVTLCSGALAEDFSRIIRSPPARDRRAVGRVDHHRVGALARRRSARLPATVTVVESLPRCRCRSLRSASAAPSAAARSRPSLQTSCSSAPPEVLFEARCWRGRYCAVLGCAGPAIRDE